MPAGTTNGVSVQEDDDIYEIPVGQEDSGVQDSGQWLGDQVEPNWRAGNQARRGVQKMTTDAMKLTWDI